MTSEFLSRNEALGFAQRTRKNLLAVLDAQAEGSDVHAVTQLVNSLLGLVIIPTEQKVAKKAANLDLEELQEQGWPQWTFELGKSQTLGDLMRNLRNASAHAGISFSSDERTLESVRVTAKNYRFKSNLPNWIASISASDLKAFCLNYIALVEDTIG